ncbi:MAG TPA: hypothetical protein VE863_10905 [Pyrinomonadaceae bacterium]|jgi:hypothetical protein|nr:hypothetical protein [Pyrinomonadaceae bacterium]
MKRFVLQLSLAVALLIVVFSAAAAQSGFVAQTWVYDPGHLGISVSQWQPGAGLPDAGGSNHALYLTKFGPTAALAASGASIKGVNGITLSTLGFDYRDDGHCGAGAPRYNVTLAGGGNFYFFFGCAYGTHTPLLAYPGWTRVRFTNADAFPADGVSAWPGFGVAQIAAIDVVFDEGTNEGPGFVYLDNLAINNTLIGKPGNAK